MSYGALIPAKCEPLADAPRLGRAIYYAVYGAIGLLLLLLLGLFIREGELRELDERFGAPHDGPLSNHD